jgi:hypothetical protein
VKLFVLLLKSAFYYSSDVHDRRKELILDLTNGEIKDSRINSIKLLMFLDKKSPPTMPLHQHKE